MLVKTIFTTSLALALMGVASTAQAQLRVDARVHASSGSCAQCDLSNKRMNGMTLNNANFAGSLFNNSNLSGGKIHGSDLSGAHFRQALLYRIEGEKVIMPGAVMEDATLTEAKLSHSSMPNINLTRADLSRASMTFNDLRAATLSNARAKGGDFSGSNFEKARLDNANFEDANLTDSNMRHTSFGNAVMLSTVLKGADLSGANMSQVQGLKQAQLDLACGDMQTRLPAGLSVPYCEGTLTASADHVADHSHAGMDPEMAKAVKRLDRALKDVEIILKATPRSNRPLRRKLESIHADIANSRRVIEN